MCRPFQQLKQPAEPIMPTHTHTLSHTTHTLTLLFPSHSDTRTHTLTQRQAITLCVRWLSALLM